MCLGGQTAAGNRATDVLQAKKAPLPMAERLEELTRENGALQREVDYYTRLLHIHEQLLPQILFLADAQRDMVHDFNAHLERLNRRWAKGDNSSTCEWRN
jgi:hypothetical protein